MSFHSGFWLSLALLVCGCGGNENGAGKQADATAAGCVWLVESSNGGRLYLCGTIHLLRPSDYPLPAAYETAYADSDEIILELPPGASEAGDLTRRMQQLGTLDEGEALQELIPQTDWLRLKEWSRKRGLPPEVMNRFRPWFAALLMVSTEYQALGARSEQGVDHHFEKRAARDGKNGMGLETVEQQLALFAGMTRKQELEVLEQTLAEVESVEAEYENMVSAWRKGDLETLEGLLFREAERYPELMEAFLHARNRAWVPELEKVLQRGGKAMVLVGAGHLGGSQGLIALPRERGHAVRQVRPAGS